MRNVAPFVGNPEELIFSIADLEARIVQRQRDIHNLANACRHDLETRMTSWPVLLAAGMSGYVLGLHGARSHAAHPAPIDNPPSGKLSQAMTFAVGMFKALQYL